MIEQFNIESIQFDDLTIGYDSEQMILQNSTVDFPMHSVVRIHGPLGCGKSTVLKVLAGLHEPTAGSYRINGASINEMSFEELIPYRLKIGYGFEYGGLLANRTLWQNLMLPLEYHNVITHEEAKSRVQKIVDLFDLNGSSHLRPSSVSGSQRKLTCVARAFVMQPQVLVLDDPTQGLNKKAIEALCMLINQQLSSKTLRHVFLTTEHPKIIQELVTCDMVFRDLKMVNFDDLYKEISEGVA